MRETNNNTELKASEVKLTYNSKIKASERVCIKHADDAAEIFFKYWDFERIEHIEEMKLLLLNRAHRVLGVANISSGGISGTVVDIKVICQYAIKSNSNSVILAHNHPSGNLNASDADRNITKRIKNALHMFDINLLDHLIINADREYSTISVD